ncbi:unnamed protein product [Trichogramma brassicae]|uniref:Uncharacterized protein n=1 Tax=Trichogramma brassicae TaxID=86971 RepID=A0A6H5J029_9HYME|nr:unnamed protein product [Trichogramma brassicae]
MGIIILAIMEISITIMVRDLKTIITLQQQESYPPPEPTPTSFIETLRIVRSFALIPKFLLTPITGEIFTTFQYYPLLQKQIRFIAKFLLTLVACKIFATFMDSLYNLTLDSPQRCANCTRKEDKKSRKCCASCQRPICSNHSYILCNTYDHREEWPAGARAARESRAPVRVQDAARADIRVAARRLGRLDPCRSDDGSLRQAHGRQHVPEKFKSVAAIQSLELGREPEFSLRGSPGRPLEDEIQEERRRESLLSRGRSGEAAFRRTRYR